MQIDDLLRNPQFPDFSIAPFSPDGKWIAYTVRNKPTQAPAHPDAEIYRLTGVVWYGESVDICVENTETGETKNLTGGEGSSWFPSWSPDGRYLAFLSDRDGSGEAKIWLWEAGKGKLRKTSDLLVRAQEILWLPNSQAVLVTALPEKVTPAEYSKYLSAPIDKAVQAEPSTPGSTVVLYTSKASSNSEIGVQSDPWSLDGDLRDLAVVNVVSGEVRRLVTGRRVSKYLPSPDGAQVAFTSQKRFERPGSQQILWELSVVSLATGKIRGVASDIQLGFDGASLSWSPDSSLLAYQTGGMDANGDCFVVRLASGTLQDLTNFPKDGFRSAPLPPTWALNGKAIYTIRGGAIWEASVNQSSVARLAQIPGHRVIEIVSQSDNRVWSPDGGKTALALTFEDQGKQSGFYRIDLETGETEQLLQDRQCYACMNTSKYVFGAPDSSRVAYFSEDVGHPSDLWTADSSFRNRRRLTHLKPQLDQYAMGDSQLISWRSMDGESLRGALLLPVNYNPSLRYPLVVWVYGNQTLSDNLNHFGLSGYGPAFNFQLLATHGYAVLLPDAPQRLGTPMLDIAKAVLPAVDRAIAIGVADPERLAVMGQSYGGYCTLSLIVQSSRFKAAAIWDSLGGDLLSAYGQMGSDGSAFATSITEQGQGLMGGTPWQFRDRYIENSPLFYFDRVDAPVLIIHGAADKTASPFLSDQAYVALRRLGKEVEYAKYEGEGHSPLYWKPANQIDLWNRVITWFDLHVKALAADSRN